MRDYAKIDAKYRKEMSELDAIPFLSRRGIMYFHQENQDRTELYRGSPSFM